MKTAFVTGLATALGLLAVAPAAVSGHGGHAGDHGWLAGAVQPLLSIDHLLAGLFVVAVGAVALALLVRAARAEEAR